MARLSEFVPGICCEHVWSRQFDGSELCYPCGATSRRDRDGLIVSYARPTVGMKSDEAREADDGERSFQRQQAELRGGGR